MIAPMPIQDIHAGREALQRDLNKVLGRQLPADRGWALVDDLTLLVPLFAENSQGQMDWYLLRLVFDHYPKGPPSAQFVNPLTLSYTFPQDVMWVPKCDGAPTIHFHPNYSGQQLICSSTTLEFYKVNHDVAQENIWNPERMNFVSTIAAIRVGLSSNFYKGRSTQ